MSVRIRDAELMRNRRNAKSMPSRSRSKSKGRSRSRHANDRDERYGPVITTNPYDNSIFCRECPANYSQPHGAYYNPSTPTGVYTTGTATYPSSYDRYSGGPGYAHALWNLISAMFKSMIEKTYPFILALIIVPLHKAYKRFIIPVIGSNDDVAGYLSEEVLATFAHFARVIDVQEAIVDSAYEVFFRAMESDIQFTGRNDLDVMAISCLFVACELSGLGEEIFPGKILETESIERTVREIDAFLRVNRFAKKLELPNAVMETAYTIYMQSKKKSTFKSLSRRDPDVLAISCIFVACRQHNVAPSFAEIFTDTGISKLEVGRIFKLLEAFVWENNPRSETRANEDYAPEEERVQGFWDLVCSWFRLGRMTTFEEEIFSVLLSIIVLVILLRLILGIGDVGPTFRHNLKKLVLLAAGEQGLASKVGK